MRKLPLHTLPDCGLCRIRLGGGLRRRGKSGRQLSWQRAMPLRNFNRHRRAHVGAALAEPTTLRGRVVQIDTTLLDGNSALVRLVFNPLRRHVRIDPEESCGKASCRSL